MPSKKQTASFPTRINEPYNRVPTSTPWLQQQAVQQPRQSKISDFPQSQNEHKFMEQNNSKDEFYILHILYCFGNDFQKASEVLKVKRLGVVAKVIERIYLKSIRGYEEALKLLVPKLRKRKADHVEARLLAQHLSQQNTRLS